ncbi:hypothetical protein PAEPH01_0761 [Pancytospora epiphaga]|nr:hypothetical protein PAEPH01_0761 [Pancytospora epiphaga]
MISPVLESIYGSIDEKITVETPQATYRGILKSCDECMNMVIATERGTIFICGRNVRLFILDPAHAFAPHLL